MTLFFEHESIRRALHATGLFNDQLQIDEPPSSTTRPVFFGWSSKDVLLQQPQNARLSLPESVYVRLPQSLKTVQDYLDLSLQSFVPTEQYRVLSVPLGQLQSAISRVQELTISDSNRLASALELRRFAREHWPGWYEEIFTELIRSVHNDQIATHGLKVVMGYATGVAASTALRPLTDWRELRSKADFIGILEDVIAYVEQGVFSDQDLQEIGVTLDWLGQLETDFSASELALREIEGSGFQLETSCNGWLTSISDSIKRLRVLRMDLTSSMRPAQEAITTLKLTLDEMIESRDQLKDSLARRD